MVSTVDRHGDDGGDALERVVLAVEPTVGDGELADLRFVADPALQRVHQV